MDAPLPANKVLEQAWVSNLASTATQQQAPAATAPMQSLPPQFFDVSHTDVFGASGRPVAADAATAASAPLPTTSKWYTKPLFIQAVCVVSVFVLTLILMVSIRPPFLYVKNPDDKTKDKEFSNANAAWVAFGTSMAALIIMVALILWQRSKKKAAAALPSTP
jgi:hypothetical protein